MLSNPSSGRRTAGRLMVLATVAVALPLTATRAINYVDVPVAPEAPSPVAPVAATAVVAQPAEPAEHAEPARLAALNINREGKLIIDGEEKEWRDLTPEEKAKVRRSIAEAKEELARTRIDREEIQREIREAMAEAKIDKEELRRDLAEARADIDRAMREVDAHAIDIRRSGQDPETIIRASLKSVEDIDVEAITRNAMNSVDHAAIEASVAAAEAGIAKAHSEIERLEQRLERDE